MLLCTIYVPPGLKGLIIIILLSGIVISIFDFLLSNVLLVKLLRSFFFSHL